MRDIILTDDGVYRCDGGASFSITHRPDGDFVEQIEWIVGLHSARNVFIDPASQWARAWPDIVNQFPNDYKDTTKSGSTVFSIRPRFGGDGFKYAIINKDDRWAFYRETTPADAMARTIGAVTRALSLDHLEAVPTTTGMEVMRKCGVDLDTPLSDDVGARINNHTSVAPELNWSRLLFPTEQHASHVIGYDVNSAYLACAQNLDFGMGEPRKVRGEFFPKDPGFYYVKATSGTSTWIGDILPNPFVNGRALEHVGWVAAPLIRFAIDHGWHVETPYGYHWPKEARKRMLGAWAAKMWQARCNTQGLARQVVKNCTNAAIGRLAHGTEQHPSGLRPDWQQLIVAEGRARRLRQMAKTPYLAPFAVNVDAFYYANDGEHYSDMEQRLDGLGGMKLMDIWEKTPRLEQLLRDRANMGDIVGEITGKVVNQ